MLFAAFDDELKLFFRFVVLFFLFTYSLRERALDAVASIFRKQFIHVCLGFSISFSCVPVPREEGGGVTIRATWFLTATSAHSRLHRMPLALPQ